MKPWTWSTSPSHQCETCKQLYVCTNIPFSSGICSQTKCSTTLFTRLGRDDGDSSSLSQVRAHGQEQSLAVFYPFHKRGGIIRNKNWQPFTHFAREVAQSGTKIGSLLPISQERWHNPDQKIYVLHPFHKRGDIILNKNCQSFTHFKRGHMIRNKKWWILFFHHWQHVITKGWCQILIPQLSAVHLWTTHSWKELLKLSQRVALTFPSLQLHHTQTCAQRRLPRRARSMIRKYVWTTETARGSARRHLQPMIGRQRNNVRQLSMWNCPSTDDNRLSVSKPSAHRQWQTDSLQTLSQQTDCKPSGKKDRLQTFRQQRQTVSLQIPS